MSEPNAGGRGPSLPTRVALSVVPVRTGEPARGAGGGPNRRDFLKATGFTFAGALLGGCQRAPVQEAIPLLTQPEGIVSGQASSYASTCGACSAGCGVLVKSLDGRPIKLEGNPDHPVSKGGLCAAGQASLLGLYDRLRLQHPLREGREASWEEIDRGIRAQLDAIRRQGGAVRVLSGTITSPRPVHSCSASWTALPTAARWSMTRSPAPPSSMPTHGRTARACYRSIVLTGPWRSPASTPIS